MFLFRIRLNLSMPRCRTTMAWVRNHEQVVVMEQTNFRHSVLEDFKKGPPDLATIDVSFISLDLITSSIFDFKDKVK